MGFGFFMFYKTGKRMQESREKQTLAEKLSEAEETEETLDNS